MNKYNITIFEDKHRTQVIDLWEKCNLIKSWNDPNKDIDRKLKVNDNLFLIVEFNKVIIGSAMIGYDGHRGSLYYLAVDPEHQRKGVGKMLMKEIEKRLIEIKQCNKCGKLKDSYYFLKIKEPKNICSYCRYKKKKTKR